MQLRVLFLLLVAPSWALVAPSRAGRRVAVLSAEDASEKKDASASVKEKMQNWEVRGPAFADTSSTASRPRRPRRSKKPRRSVVRS